MQRVLSFPPQSSRRFGDPSEFVSKRMCFSFMFSIAFLSILAGFLLGRFVFDQELELSKAKLRKINQQQQQQQHTVSSYSTSRENISSLLSEISPESLEHYLKSLQDTAGEPTNFHEARLIASLMKESRFDLISPLVDRQVNLSYPDRTRDNKILLYRGDTLSLSINDSRAGSEAGGYHSAAAVEGNIHYVNFGRDEDYHHLDSLGLNVKDSVVLIRVGRVPPLDLVMNALEHEAIGIILYKDPQQADVEGEILSSADLAKLNFLYRTNAEKAMPVLCICPEDAEKLFREMSTSESSSESWRGDLNTSYPIGPGFAGPDGKLIMHVNTVTTVRKYYDVFGAIQGTQEPDRFVMVAQERKPDRYSTVIFMELIRALGVLKNTKDWQPSRSVVFASWGMETLGYSHAKDWWSQQQMRTVAYLKIDSALLGNDSTRSRGSPILEKVFREAAAAAALPSPDLDVMLETGTDVDLVENGIPFLELKPGKSHGDRRLKEVTSFWAYAIWKLSESGGLPFSLDTYVTFLSYSADVIKQRFKMITQKHNLFLESLFDATQRLVFAVLSFQSKWSRADRSKLIEMRIMNDQFLQFVQALSCQKEDGFDHSFRHIIFSQSTQESDPKSGFGLLQDLLRQTTSTEAPDDLQQQIINHLADLVECLNAARFALSDGLEHYVRPE